MEVRKSVEEIDQRNCPSPKPYLKLHEPYTLLYPATPHYSFYTPLRGCSKLLNVFPCQKILKANPILDPLNHRVYIVGSKDNYAKMSQPNWRSLGIGVNWSAIGAKGVILIN